MARWEPAALYEKFYCARGDMENRIKEQQLDLFADRTSTHWMASNQLRLWFSTFAHLVMSTLRAEVLRGTALAVASTGQIRLRLFKIAARLTVSVRRIHIELCSAYPLRDSSAWRTSGWLLCKLRGNFPAESQPIAAQQARAGAPVAENFCLRRGKNWLPSTHMKQSPSSASEFGSSEVSEEAF